MVLEVERRYIKLLMARSVLGCAIPLTRPEGDVAGRGGVEKIGLVEASERPP
jgi:hypothetical protein